MHLLAYSRILISKKIEPMRFGPNKVWNILHQMCTQDMDTVHMINYLEQPHITFSLSWPLCKQRQKHPMIRYSLITSLPVLAIILLILKASARP